MGRQREVVEEILVKTMHSPKVLTSTTATFGELIDTQGYDSAVIRLNVGTNFQAPATLSAILYEQESGADMALNLVPVTLANLGTLTGNGANQAAIGGIATKNFKRFLALRLQASASNGANPTIGVSAVMLLGKADKEVVGNNPVFNLVDDGVNKV
jgi:hypothetical protein